jgi:transposase
MSRANAALTPRLRLRLARLVIDHGWPVSRASEQFNCSWPTAKGWAERFAAMGEAGMTDRSSRPHRVANPTRNYSLHVIFPEAYCSGPCPARGGVRVGYRPLTLRGLTPRP